jgi:two-component system phosphate regulon sensor histidine kinase PhoR
MSILLKFLVVLCAAALACLVAGFLWSEGVGLAVFFAVLAGSALGRLLAGSPKAEGGLPAASPDFRAQASGEGRVEATPASALLEATMDSMREGVLVLDQELRVIASNRAARDIFTTVAGPLERKRLSDLTRSSTIHAAFGTALVQDERAEAKVEMHGRDLRTFDLRVVPLRFSDERNTRGAIGVFFDITRMERLERVRQEFLSNVSHELRTPLTAIIAFIETLEEGGINDPENSRRFLSVIRKNATRMHNLIDDILELSAIEAGTVSVQLEPVRLHLLVNDILTALASRASARSVKLNNEVSAETFVLADARRLEQMLTNLVDNAIKFNREGGSVTIGHARSARDRISVADTGDGIPPEHIKRIFERFYRIDRARSREMGGTGLGLAIVKHLARAHGGEVGVESASGAGSTFTIELPLGQFEDQGTPQPSDSAAEQEPGQHIAQAARR